MFLDIDLSLQMTMKDMKHGVKTYILLIVSILMLAAGVFPHHHHGEELCMDTDLETYMPPAHCEDGYSHYPGDEDRHECGSTCITRFSVPSFHHRTDCTPEYSFCALLRFPSETTVYATKTLSAEEIVRCIGKLHDRHFSDVRNFRAPPAPHC